MKYLHTHPHTHPHTNLQTHTRTNTHTHRVWEKERENENPMTHCSLSPLPLSVFSLFLDCFSVARYQSVLTQWSTRIQSGRCEFARNKRVLKCHLTLCNFKCNQSLNLIQLFLLSYLGSCFSKQIGQAHVFIMVMYSSLLLKPTSILLRAYLDEFVLEW